MKIEFKRNHSGEMKRVILSVGGHAVTSLEEWEVKGINWKNASEAKHACREELQKWIDEENLPELPTDYRVERDQNGDLDLIHEGDSIAAIFHYEDQTCLEQQAERSEAAAKFFRWAAERKGK